MLGAFGFAAAALALAARDAFIGWDADQRGRQLHRVLGLSRFLIRPGAACRNLASKALSLALRRLPDVPAALRLPPPAGGNLCREACTRALRWPPPTGCRRERRARPLRGQRDRGAGETRWRATGAQLGVPAPEAPQALGAADKLAADVWAEHEFGGAPLGDVRLSQRLVKIVDQQAQAPTKSFPGAAQNDQAAVRGYYRLIDHPADSNILAPHRERTLQRMQGQAAVLCSRTART